MVCPIVSIFVLFSSAHLFYIGSPFSTTIRCSFREIVLSLKVSSNLFSFDDCIGRRGDLGEEYRLITFYRIRVNQVDGREFLLGTRVLRGGLPCVAPIFRATSRRSNCVLCLIVSRKRERENPSCIDSFLIGHKKFEAPRILLYLSHSGP